MKFVATKTADQLDLQALHRVRERLVSQRTGIINQIRAFLLERSIACAREYVFTRRMPPILATPPDVLSPRMVRIVEDLACDWRRLDERVEGLSNESKPSLPRLQPVSGLWDPDRTPRPSGRQFDQPGLSPASPGQRQALVRRPTATRRASTKNRRHDSGDR